MDIRSFEMNTRHEVSNTHPRKVVAHALQERLNALEGLLARVLVPVDRQDDNRRKNARRRLGRVVVLAGGGERHEAGRAGRGELVAQRAGEGVDEDALAGLHGIR